MKKYFWLKLQENFFERDEIKVVENMENGKDYIIFYMKLLLKSIKNEGNLYFKETIPYSERMLAVITNTNIDIVKAAIALFLELKLIEQLDNGILFMTEAKKMMGNIDDSSMRVKAFRERKKLEKNKLNDDVTRYTPVTCNNVTIAELDIDIDIDIEKENIKEKEKPASLRFAYMHLFEKFWECYPIKKAKEKAKQAFVKLKPDGILLAKMLESLSNQQKEKDAQAKANQFVSEWPMATTWLNQKRWEDEINLNTEVKQKAIDPITIVKTKQRNLQSEMEQCYYALFVGGSQKYQKIGKCPRNFSNKCNLCPEHEDNMGKIADY